MEELAIRPALVGVTEPLKPRKSTQMAAEMKENSVMILERKT